jgi:hypothetical protein
LPFLIISRWQFSFDWTLNRFSSFGSDIIWCEKIFHDVYNELLYWLFNFYFCCCCRELTRYFRRSCLAVLIYQQPDSSQLLQNIIWYERKTTIIKMSRRNAADWT